MAKKVSWNNKNLQRHLQRKHPNEMEGVLETRALSSSGKTDTKDETARGKIPLFSLDNQAKKKDFLSMVSTYNFNYFDICL